MPTATVPIEADSANRNMGRSDASYPVPVPPNAVTGDNFWSAGTETGAYLMRSFDSAQVGAEYRVRYIGVRFNVHSYAPSSATFSGARLLSVLLIGLYDQSNDVFVPHYSAAKDSYEADARFVSAIDDELPEQAEIFQLPYVAFSEGDDVHELHYNEPLKPYLHDNDLRWSFGAAKGRPAADWQADLAEKPTKDLVDTIIAEGFDGLYIDCLGYPDRAAELEGELGELLGV